MSTSVVERERAAGKTVGTLYGMGRSNPIPPVGDFHVFAKAGKDKVNFATIHKDR